MKTKNRYYYEIGIQKQTFTGYLMADDLNQAMDIIDEEMNSIGHPMKSIDYVNLDKVENNDILASQITKIQLNHDEMKTLFIDTLEELGLDKNSIMNYQCRLQNNTCNKITKVMGWK